MTASALKEEGDSGYIVWADDHTTYGPVELPTLVTWVKEERVTADTWVFANKDSSWQQAGQVPELRMFFSDKSKSTEAAQASVKGIDPRALRRVKILGVMTDEQLERFTQFMEVQKAPQYEVIVHQGDHGDAMYLIIEGELRVRVDVAGRESILATLSVGDFFGDISLFDHGPRSADVVANTDSLLLKITSSAFDEISKAAPDLATPFLRAIGQTLSARLRASNKRHGDAGIASSYY